MRHLFPICLLALTATPALAHGGAHMHPHGVEGWVASLGILALVGAAWLIAYRGRK